MSFFNLEFLPNEYRKHDYVIEKNNFFINKKNPVICGLVEKVFESEYDPYFDEIEAIIRSENKYFSELEIYLLMDIFPEECPLVCKLWDPESGTLRYINRDGEIIEASEETLSIENKYKPEEKIIKKPRLIQP